MPKATIRDERGEVLGEAVTNAWPELAEEIGSEIQQIFASGHRPEFLTIEITGGPPAAMKTGPATKVWDGTNIDRLATHYLVDGHALCSTKLSALFEDTGDAVTCKRCLAASTQPPSPQAGETPQERHERLKHSASELFTVCPDEGCQLAAGQSASSSPQAEVQDCERCGGRGFNFGAEPDGMLRCETCNGTGKQSPAEPQGDVVEALEFINGCFVPGKRKTYGSPDETLDTIRARANDALAAHRGQCRVCHGDLEGASGPECDETGCPERDGSSA